MENTTEEKLICPQCRYIGNKERFSSGSYKLEILLWLMLFVPGALYTTWRFFNEYSACPVCKNQTMTPLNSSLGQKLMSEHDRMREPLNERALARFLKKLFYGK